MTSSAPSVALIGAAGFIGKPLLSAFIPAAQAGTINRLVILTRHAEKLQDVAASAEVKEVVFEEKSSLVDALRGVDVIVSAMGMSGDVSAVKKNIVDAAAETGVRVYGPSLPWMLVDGVPIG
jgi:putative NADH-flavin reductase